MTNEDIVQLIHDLGFYAYCNVTFKTKKGHVRTMTCTTNLHEVPPEDWGGVNNPVLTGPAIIQVYDLDNSGWRAFRKDSVITWDTHSTLET